MKKEHSDISIFLYLLLGTVFGVVGTNYYNNIKKSRVTQLTKPSTSFGVRG